MANYGEAVDMAIAQLDNEETEISKRGKCCEDEEKSAQSTKDANVSVLW